MGLHKASGRDAAPAAAVKARAPSAYPLSRVAGHSLIMAVGTPSVSKVVAMEASDTT